jgi:hypothetical protein
MKTIPEALDTAENESVSAKLENGGPTTSVPSKMISGAQNFKTGPDVFVIAQNGSGNA